MWFVRSIRASVHHLVQYSWVSLLLNVKIIETQSFHSCVLCLCHPNCLWVFCWISSTLWKQCPFSVVFNFGNRKILAGIAFEDYVRRLGKMATSLAAKSSPTRRETWHNVQQHTTPSFVFPLLRTLPTYNCSQTLNSLQKTWWANMNSCHKMRLITICFLKYYL